MKSIGVSASGLSLTALRVRTVDTQGAASEKSHASDSTVQCSVVDRGDGSYELLWACHRAGTFPIDVLIGPYHVGGSPMKLTVRPARPAVEVPAISAPIGEYFICYSPIPFHSRHISPCHGEM